MARPRGRRPPPEDHGRGATVGACGREKRMLGESLFPKVREIHPLGAAVITGAVLSLDNRERLSLLDSPRRLRRRVVDTAWVWRVQEQMPHGSDRVQSDDMLGGASSRSPGRKRTVPPGRVLSRQAAVVPGAQSRMLQDGAAVGAAGTASPRADRGGRRPQQPPPPGSSPDPPGDGTATQGHGEAALAMAGTEPSRMTQDRVSAVATTAVPTPSCTATRVRPTVNR